jgi:vancomycin resistance protein YoaR
MKRRYKFKNIFFPALIFFIAIFSFFFILELINLGRVAYGLKIGGIEIGGLKSTDAEIKLKEKFSQWKKSPIIFSYQNQQFSLLPEDLGIFLDQEKSITQAYNFGREKNIFIGLSKQIKILIPFANKNIPPVFSFDEKKFDQATLKLFSSEENPAQNSSLLYNIEKRQWEPTPANKGVIFDRKKIKTSLGKTIASLSSSPIELILIDDFPEVIEKETDQAKEKASQILDNSPYLLKYNNKSWKIDQETLLDWIIFTPADENASQNKILGVSLNQEKISDILTEIAPSINQEPINAQLSFENGKVSIFAISEDGLRLDIEKSAEKINEILASDKGFGAGNLPPDKSIELTIIKKSPMITTESIDNLGLISLLGKGISNFAGSPNNRIHNIKIGAAKFNGVLLKPNEEFSFSKIVGEIGPKQGYLPELVIKNHKTIPEYGGGICQVSTTIFRAAINSGLKITERYPHAFAVKYYNPQGFDSTVYPPHPDLRFINDSPKNILIQAKIEGTALTFEFYGTPDNREVKIKGPTILESNPDGSMKTILYQEIWQDGKMKRQDKFFSNYKSPALYPIEKNPLE